MSIIFESIYHTQEPLSSRVARDLPQEVLDQAKLTPVTGTHEGWHLNNFFPADWYKDQTGDNRSMWGSLTWQGNADFFKWVNPSCTTKRISKEHGSPYNMQVLLGRVLPLLFGIYREGNRLIQINFMKVVAERQFIYRELSVKELNSYLFTEINKIRSDLDLTKGCTTLVSNVFSDWGWNSEKNHNPWMMDISWNEVLFHMPSLNIENGTYIFHCPSRDQSSGRIRWNTLEDKLPTVMTNKDQLKTDILDYFSANKGEMLTQEALHSVLDAMNFNGTKKSGRVQAINRIICERGLKLVRKQVKRNGKVSSQYQVAEMTVEHDLSF